MPMAPQELRTYFVTSATASRRRLFQIEQNAILFIEVLQEQRAKNRLQLHAFVVMPDHVHLIITPAPEVSLEKAMQYIKGNFSFRLKSKLDVWERSYTNHRIVDRYDYIAGCLLRRCISQAPQPGSRLSPTSTPTPPPTRPAYSIPRQATSASLFPPKSCQVR